MVITRMREKVLSSPRLSNVRERFGGVVVIGGANIDLRGRPAGEVLEKHTSNPGKINVGSGAGKQKCQALLFPFLKRKC